MSEGDEGVASRQPISDKHALSASRGGNEGHTHLEVDKERDSIWEIRVLVPAERGGSISEIREGGEPIEGAWIRSVGDRIPDRRGQRLIGVCQ